MSTNTIARRGTSGQVRSDEGCGLFVGHERGHYGGRAHLVPSDRARAAPTLLLEMMWDYYGSAASLWPVVIMAIVWLSVIGLAVVLIRASIDRRPRIDQPIDILRRRLAAGEISQEEFERTRKALQS